MSVFAWVRVRQVVAWAAMAPALVAISALDDLPWAMKPYRFALESAVAVVLAITLYDGLVLFKLSRAARRMAGGQPPLREGVDYGVGPDRWTVPVPPNDPYRAQVQRRQVARGSPHHAANRIVSDLILRAATVLLSLIGIALAGSNRSGCSYPKSALAKTACYTMRLAATQWRAAHAADAGCPAAADLQRDGDLDSSFSLRDPWGYRYRIGCEHDEIACHSSGADGKDGTDDDIDLPFVETARPAR